jgi:hypothetical protein
LEQDLELQNLSKYNIRRNINRGIRGDGRPFFQNLDQDIDDELMNLITWKGAKSLGGKGVKAYGKVKGLGLF